MWADQPLYIAVQDIEFAFDSMRHSSIQTSLRASGAGLDSVKALMRELSHFKATIYVRGWLLACRSFYSSWGDARTGVGFVVKLLIVFVVGFIMLVAVRASAAHRQGHLRLHRCTPRCASAQSPRTSLHRIGSLRIIGIDAHGDENLISHSHI